MITIYMYEKEMIIMIMFMGNLQAKLSLIYVYKQYAYLQTHTHTYIGAGNFDSVGSHSSYVCIYFHILVFLYIHTTHAYHIYGCTTQTIYICICM